MILFGLEEFTAKRKTAQTDIEDALRPIVERAVDLKENTNGWTELLAKVRDEYEQAYADESGLPAKPPTGKFLTDVESTLKKTKDRDEHSVDRIVVWLATAILTEATIEASGDDEEELFLEWVDMGDNHVRETHVKANGQQRPVGEKFLVGGAEMTGPGDPTVDIALWINCRCTLRPVLASEALVAAADPKDTSTVVVALPKKTDPVHKIGDEQKHATLAFMGDHQGDKDKVHEAVKKVAGDMAPFTAPVSGKAVMGPDKAKTLLLDSHHIQDTRDALMADPDVKAGVDGADAHPHFVPHVTTTYGDEPDEQDDVGSIDFDRLAVWDGDDQTEYPLGDQMPDDQTPPEDKDKPEVPTEAAQAVPWHGVLAPEGLPSGDGRMFAADSLRMRDLPLPLTWQKASSEGHGGSVTVAKIEKIERLDGMMRASGYFLATPEADEVVGMIAEFGKFGVSVDADDATFEIDEENEMVVFTSARIASASIVAIPAFAEAYVALGPWDDQDLTAPMDPEALVAAASVFVDVAPGQTEDGPGWLTNPVDTDRLRDYWTKGAGAAKIAWGVPGDFNRCRVEVGPYVKPEYISGYCANRHKDAIGVWPGQEAKAADVLEATDPAEALTLVASVGLTAPAGFFTDPEFTERTALTITDEGEVFGHLAEWGVCHIGIQGRCQTAPHSAHHYAFFRYGQVALDDGTRVATGPLTIGGGHANGRLGVRAAVEHYDSTSTVFADVAVGEDDIGIWYHGWVRPGTSPEMVTAAMGSGLSGDWRGVGDEEPELVAALAVNTSGFPVPRAEITVVGGQQVSLVAAGMVLPDRPKVDAAERIADTLAEQVAAALEGRAARRSKMAALAAQVNEKVGV